MPSNSEPSTPPPPRIGKIGPYTVFVTPLATPEPVQQTAPPPVMAPPAQFHRGNPSSFGFVWDAVAKVQNAHANLDEHVAHWFGLNQSKYQWALDDYFENNEKMQNQTEAKLAVKQSRAQNVVRVCTSRYCIMMFQHSRVKAALMSKRVAGTCSCLWTVCKIKSFDLFRPGANNSGFWRQLWQLKIPPNER